MRLIEYVNRVLWRGVVLSGAVICLLLGSVTISGEAAWAAENEVATKVDTRESLEKYVDKKFAEREELIKAKYESKIESLDTNSKNIETMIEYAKLFAVIISVFALLLGAFFGKNMKDVQSTARNAAQDAFRSAIRDKTKDGKDLEELIKSAKQISEELVRIREGMTGYDALIKVANSASGFDPMTEYYSIDQEIEAREDETKKLLRGDNSVDIKSTTRDTAFRQKAAVVFEQLLKAVADDMKSGKYRFRSDTLYNAAANASKINLDFVSLELMEAAVKSDKKKAPEIETRLIRQRISMQKITPDEGLAALKSVIGRTNGFDLHLVCAEAFNSALHLAIPVEMAHLVRNSLKPELKDVSYALLNGARLLFMGDRKADWDLALEWYRKGLMSLASESPTARWYEHSWSEVGSLLLERPDLIDLYFDELIAAIGSVKDMKQLARKVGQKFLLVLAELGAFEKVRSAVFGHTSGDDDDDGPGGGGNLLAELIRRAMTEKNKKDE